MSAQVEVQSGEVGRAVVGGRLHLSLLTDSSNKSPIAINQSHIITAEPNKPVLGPKPRLSPKPFAVDKNPAIKPILAPKPLTKPRPESTRLAGYKPELPGNPKSQPPATTVKGRVVSTNPNRPAPTSFKTSNKLNTGQTNKPVFQPFKPAPPFDPGDPSKPSPPVPAQRQKSGVSGLGYSKSLKTPPPAEWSGSTKKEDEKDKNTFSKGGASITRAKSMGFLAQVGQEEEEKNKPEEAVPLRPQPRGSRPRPVSAIFLDTSTKIEAPVPSPRWAERRPLSADLTSKFESIGLSLHRAKANTKETTPEETALLQMREQEKTPKSSTPQSADVVAKPSISDQSSKKLEEITMKEFDENKRRVSIRSRISLLLDSSSTPGTGATGQGSDLDSPLNPGTENEPPVGVKQLIKQLTVDTPPAPIPIMKPAAKPRPLPLDLTKRFTSERSPDFGSASINEATGQNEISRDPQRRYEEMPPKPSDDGTLDLNFEEQFQKAFTSEVPKAGLTSGATTKESSPNSEVQTVRASLFDNVVERRSVLMLDEEKSINKPADSLRSQSFKRENSEDEGTLVTATYKEPVSPSSPLRVIHAFDKVQAIEENRAVSENVPSAQWEDKALTLRSRRSEGSRSVAERTRATQPEPTLAVNLEQQHPRYLRVGALPKWTDAGMEKGILKESQREGDMAVDKDRHREAEQEEVSGAPKRLKMLQAEEQQKSRSTYFALTGQVQEQFSPVDRGASLGDMVVPFDNFSVKSTLGGSQGKILPVRRNPSLDEAFANTSQDQVEESIMRSHREIRTDNRDVQMTEEMLEFGKRELKEETEKDKAKMKDFEREKQRQLEIDKQAHLEFARMKERERQREFERQRQKAFEKEKQEFEKKQRALEQQKQIDLEKQRLQEIERHKQMELEKQRQQEIERRKLIQRENQRLQEIERQKQMELEKQRQQEIERRKLIEREHQRQQEMERQKLMEHEKQMLQEVERRKQIELEKRKLQEMERKKQMERESQRQQEMEKQKQIEYEKQRLQEMEKQKQIEYEKQRLQEMERHKQKELERERQHQLEKEKRELEREMERERLREQERERQHEQERQRQKEEERQRELDKERQLLEIQKEKQKIEELERRQLLDFQKQKQKERERQQIMEVEQQRLRDKLEREEEKIKQMALEQEMLRLKELEKERERQREMERQIAMEKEKQRQLERQRQLDIERQELANQKLRQRELEKERLRKEEMEKLIEIEKRHLQEFEKQKQADRDKQQVLEFEKHRLREKMEKEEADKMRQVAKQQEAERQRLKEKQRKEEQERVKLESSPLRPQVLDLDSVLRTEPSSKVTAQRSDPATRWKEPSLRVEQSYKPAVFDTDIFTSQTKLSASKDLFPVSGIQGVDTGFGAKFQPTYERDISWKVPPQTSMGFSSPVWMPSPQDPWELCPVEISVDKPVAEHRKHSNIVSPEQLLLRQEERLQAPQRHWSALVDEPLNAAPTPDTDTKAVGSPGEVSSSTAAEQVWLRRELLPDSRGGHGVNRRSQELNRMRSRSVSRRSAPSSSTVEGSLSRMRSRSAHRERDRDSWVQQNQSVTGEEEVNDSETLVCETDSQYGTWETGLRTDDSLTPATPSSESNLSPSPRKPTPPHTPGDRTSQFVTDTVDSLLSPPSADSQTQSFPDAPTTLLDTSALRSRAQLGKKRAPRTRPTRAARQNAAEAEQEGGNKEDWLYTDSTDAKFESKEEDSDSEEQPRGADTAHSTAATQPQRVALFPGMDPSALKAQLKKRTESDSQTDGATPSPSQLSRSPKSPFLPRAARVLPPPGGKENGQEDSPQWLKELKSKKRLSQYDSEN